MGVLAATVAFALLRVVVWCRTRSGMTDPDVARHQLLLVEIRTAVLFADMALWVWALLPYANPQESVYFSFFTALTGAYWTICGISRPRLVGVCLAMTLIVFCALFFNATETFFYFATAQIGVTHLVFFLASSSYKSRLVQSVTLLNTLDAENRRSAKLADTNQYMAPTDTLTGLPNRRKFFMEVEASYDPQAESMLPVIGLIDLDELQPDQRRVRSSGGRCGSGRNGAPSSIQLAWG